MYKNNESLLKYLIDNNKWVKTFFFFLFIVIHRRALRQSTITMMNEDFIKLNHALIVRWEDELVRVYLSIIISQFSFLFQLFSFFYALAISSSSIWLSRCNFISMACKSIWSIWWTFKCTTTFTNIISIKYTWNSCTISYILSSFDWYTWYAIYSSTNRLIFLKISISLKKLWMIYFRSGNIFG